MAQDLIAAFVTLWVTIDPIGTVSIFLSVVGQRSPAELRRIGTQAVLVAGGVLIGFLVLGQILLEAMGIGIEAFQVAGGIVLFRFALTMIFAADPSADHAAGLGHSNPAIFPVGIPAIAGPGAMLAVVVLTDNHRFNIAQQAATAGVLLVVLLLQWLLLLAATSVQRWLGAGGTSILSRVMGLVLAALAVQTVVEGLCGLGVLKLAN